MQIFLNLNYRYREYLAIEKAQGGCQQKKANDNPVFIILYPVQLFLLSTW